RKNRSHRARRRSSPAPARDGGRRRGRRPLDPVSRARQPELLRPEKVGPVSDWPPVAHLRRNALDDHGPRYSTSRSGGGHSLTHAADLPTVLFQHERGCRSAILGEIENDVRRDSPGEEGVRGCGVKPVCRLPRRRKIERSIPALENERESRRQTEGAGAAIELILGQHDLGTILIGYAFVGKPCSTSSETFGQDRADRI